MMKKFMDKDFLLETETAKKLFHEHAAKMPIIDYHCHINPQEIAEDRQFKNITEVWLGGDHYKWRMIRSNGVDEKYITGDESTDREKFQKFAEALPRAIANPVICTTDDPADDLRWHKKIREDGTCSAKVLPAMRPDAALRIEKPEWASYMKRLAEVSDTDIKTMDDIRKALRKRIDFFESMGCKASDHALEYVFCNEAKEDQLDDIVSKVLGGKVPTTDEIEKYKTALLLFLGEEYSKRGWAMQIHYSAMRDNNTRMFKKMGPDTGFDSIGSYNCGEGIVALLDAMEKKGCLPKTILYSLNPSDNALIGTIIGSFQGPEVPGKIQQGAAWWFNDTKSGMEAQITNVANLSVLGNVVGMLTDSRSFLSYTRHEYYRRILCNWIGRLVENGEYPDDMDFLGKLVEDISYNNAARYFGF